MYILGFFFLMFMYFGCIGHSIKNTYYSAQNRNKAIAEGDPFYWDEENKMRDTETNKKVCLFHDSQKGDYLHAVDGSYDKPIVLRDKNVSTGPKYGKYEIVILTENKYCRKFYQKNWPIDHYYHIFADDTIISFDSLGKSFYDKELKYIRCEFYTSEEIEREKERLEDLCKA